MIIKTKKKGDVNKKVDKKTFRIALVVALILFLTAVGTAVVELHQISADIADQRARLENSIADSVTSYMETKYLADIDGITGEGDLNGNALTQEEIDALMQEVMSVLNESLNDDVYKGLSTLAVDELKSKIDQAIQNALINNNIDKDLISNEIQLLVMKALESYLNETLQQLEENNTNISELSSIINQSNTKIDNIKNSITNVQKSYEEQIANLKKIDANLAKQIEEILKGSAKTSEEYNTKIANLLKQISELNQSLSNANTTINNNYNTINSKIDETNKTIINNQTDINNQIENIKEVINQNQENSVKAKITARTDGGNGNQFIIVTP